MLDYLRDQATSSQFEEEVVPIQEEDEPPKLPLDQSLRINAQQRFILSVMLLFVVCLLGVMFLFVTGKVFPPFLY
jgi:hypothetical protein